MALKPPKAKSLEIVDSILEFAATKLREWQTRTQASPFVRVDSGVLCQQGYAGKPTSDIKVDSQENVAQTVHDIPEEVFTEVHECTGDQPRVENMSVPPTALVSPSNSAPQDTLSPCSQSVSNGAPLANDERSDDILTPTCMGQEPPSGTLEDHNRLGREQSHVDHRLRTCFRNASQIPWCSVRRSGRREMRLRANWKMRSGRRLADISE